MTSPRRRTPASSQRPHRLHVAGQRPLHVRDAEAVDAAVLDEPFGLEAPDPRQPRLPAGVRRVHVAVEHERLPAARAFPDADDVRAPVLDLLPLHLEPHVGELVAHPLAHRLLVAGRARDRDESTASATSRSAIDLNGNAAAPPCRTARSARGGRSPHSSSMTCVQPASRYSSIAAMQSAGVPAIGLHLSRISSVTSAFAASRPPRSIASATGRISSWVSPARSSSVSAAPLMFCTLFARYMPAISRAPSRPCVAVGLVDRRDDRAADVDVGGDVLARVANERRRRDRRRQAAVGDLAGERLHLRRRRGDVDRRHLARRLGLVLQARARRRSRSSPSYSNGSPPSTPRTISTASRIGPSVFFV